MNSDTNNGTLQGLAFRLVKNGVDSLYGESHRKNPEVVGDRDEDLAVLTSQTA